jgi:hypothetical protein
MRRRVIQVDIVLNIFAVVPLAVGEPKETLLQDRVPAIPQGNGEAGPLMAIADAGQPLFIPAEGPCAAVVCGK